jgi:hypothetical protein
MKKYIAIVVILILVGVAYWQRDQANSPKYSPEFPINSNNSSTTDEWQPAAGGKESKMSIIISAPGNDQKILILDLFPYKKDLIGRREDGKMVKIIVADADAGNMCPSTCNGSNYSPEVRTWKYFYDFATFDTTGGGGGAYLIGDYGNNETGGLTFRLKEVKYWAQ